MIDVADREFIDADALFVLDGIYNLLPASWQHSVRQDCESGEEFWAVELVLQGAIETGVAVNKGVLAAVERIAVGSDGDFAERIRRLAQRLE
ncbi:hypothetical protein [Corynebacterium lactis]|uniref:Uncharacterized protein n=1 Tax=Corynebacterium lactis RW2-5 TaxID=1408189 RepID=A0A0K2H3C4_9CORY|nr:hypothetical protein [Corynebacterium lactis]ALA68539.1 hypothetical protein CLAC_07190 [Corynebacterium lactis RW2-5]